MAVYDQLIAEYPVAGGVVVQEGIVYAAAGITHYDGTYVVALNGETGELVASNNTSGTLEPEVNNGVSLQGELTIVDGELQFLAGGVYETARYELKTLKCLNDPKHQVNSQFRTAFYPYYPNYGKYVSLDHTCEDGCMLTHDASYEGSQFTNLYLQEALPEGVTLPPKEAARWIVRRGGTPPKRLWIDTENRRFNAFIVGKDSLLAAGHPDLKPEDAFLAATEIKTGKDLWKQALPAVPVKGGAALDAAGRVFVTLENGKLICFESQ